MKPSFIGRCLGTLVIVGIRPSSSYFPVSITFSERFLHHPLQATRRASFHCPRLTVMQCMDKNQDGSPTTSSSSSGGDSSTTKSVTIRVLALHGSEGNGQEFPKRLHALQMALAQRKNVHLEITAIDAPFPKGPNNGYSWWTMPPGVRSFNAVEYTGFDESATKVLTIWDRQSSLSSSSSSSLPPFDLVLGHSQGAVLIAALLALGRVPYHPPLGYILNGVSFPNPYRDEIANLKLDTIVDGSTNNDDNNITPPPPRVLFILGRADKITPNSSGEELADGLSNAGFAVSSIYHDGGHGFPNNLNNNDDETVDAIVDWLHQDHGSGPTRRGSRIWSDLPRRLATICIGFPLVWTMLRSTVLASVFFMGAHALSAWEFTGLERTNHRNTAALESGSTVITSPGGNIIQQQRQSIPNTPARMVFCVISLILASIPSSPSSSTTTTSSVFLTALVMTGGLYVILHRHHWTVGLLLVTIPFRMWMVQCRDFASTISLLLVVWNADTGALLGGRLASTLLPHLTHQRLPVPTWIRSISPKKSMEGFVGGILGGMWTTVSWIPIVVSWASIDTTPSFDYLWLEPTSRGLYRRLGMGLCLSVLAVAGDLVESSIKRQSQSKDSGTALPGHGGILDRFDSSLLAVLAYRVLIEWAETHTNATTTTTSAFCPTEETAVMD